MAGTIRVGVGGWTYEPWRGVFFPDKLAQAKELAYASSKLTTIEINGTYYRTQAPSTFAKWRGETPDGFVFSVKALRFTTNRKVLAEAGESVGKFLGSGLTELGDKLGPILWQFAPTKKFDPVDFGAFLDLLPKTQDGMTLRHVVEVRHDSFRTPDFVALARKHGVAVVYANGAGFPEIADPTADFIYARLQGTHEAVETGYKPEELDHWAGVARAWAAGESPAGLEYVAEPPPPSGARDAFVYIISGAKVRNPAAAQALIERLG
jgi:uncharacterized protein YecE (DUF72 family)